MVSFSHGRVFASSAKPPQRSTTVSPSTVAQKLAPMSAPLVRLASKAERTGANLSRVKPATEPSAMIVSTLVCASLAQARDRARLPQGDGRQQISIRYKESRQATHQEWPTKGSRVRCQRP